MSTQSKLLFSFLRINDSGAFEKVSWHKNKEGKFSTCEPHTPSPQELRAVMNSQFNETSIA